ncbi:MAG: U32 family peptidase [Devosiaceae bacterium]|nr:U32 family peptidase [Devosiaceae bacterium]
MKLTMGPIPFHWNNETRVDFYARLADESPVDTIYMGEVICSKREPFFRPLQEEVVARLERGGKTVVMSSLTEVMLKRERKMMSEICDISAREIEINNSSGLTQISGKKHRIGPMMNVYNEATMGYLAGQGATHFSLPVELPATSTRLLAQAAGELGVGVEVQVFGRASVAISARCYHARAHNRIKDNCLFVCEKDPDGMALKTLDDKDFLTINGIQTLSHSYVNLLAEIDDLAQMGVTHCRLLPHSQDMIVVANVFRGVMDGKLDVEEGQHRLKELDIPAPFSNGFWYGKAGHLNIDLSMT